MSYSLFQAEILAGLRSPHSDKTRGAEVIAKAYTNLILRHFETLTGAGQYYSAPTKTAILQSGLQTIFLQNLSAETNRVSQFNKGGPYMKLFWAGAVIPGPLGIVTVTNTGTWKGPVMPENNDPTLWLRVLCGITATHLLSLSGTYLNFYTGATSAWSGGLLLTFP